jgi:hypothetical protein
MPPLIIAKMKTHSLGTIFYSTVLTAVIAASAHGAPTSSSASAPVIAPGGATMTISTSTAQAPANLNAEVAGPVRWVDIKDYTYDTRDRFFAGLKLLEATADNEIALLDARRRAMPSTMDTQEWDFNMKEMSNAREYLKDMGDELRKASPEAWDQQKDRVGEAWTRTQDAYSKVRASTTN